MKPASFAQRTYLADLRMQLNLAANDVHTMSARECSLEIGKCLAALEDYREGIVYTTEEAVF